MIDAPAARRIDMLRALGLVARTLVEGRRARRLARAAGDHASTHRVLPIARAGGGACLDREGKQAGRRRSKLAAWIAVWLACITTTAPALAQTDEPAPFSDPAWGRTTATPEVLAERIAAIDAAIAGQDEQTLVLAVLRVRTYDNVDLIPVLERVIALPTWPCDVASAEAIVDERHPHRVAESTGIEFSTSEMEVRVRAFEEWRPHGVAAVTYRTASRKAEAAVGHFIERHDRASYDALARCFDRSEVASDPAKASLLIAALLTFDDLAPELEERMLSRMLAVDELPPALLKFTELPPYATTPERNSYVHAFPAESVARSLIKARARSKTALLALADGLMLGSSRFADDVETTHRLCVDDPVLAVSAKIGRLCASALQAQFGEPFTWADAVSRDKVRERIDREIRDAKRPHRAAPDAASVTASIAAIEAALAARDGAALDESLAGVLGFESDALFDVYRRILLAEPFPTDVAAATEAVDRRVADLSARERTDASKRAVASWRATGVEVEACRVARARCVRVCDALIARGDEPSHALLFDVLLCDDLHANPFAHATVIEALGTFDFTTGALELELCTLLRSAEKIDASWATWTAAPITGSASTLALLGRFDAGLCPRIEPHLAAARYFATRKTKRQSVVLALIECLMHGFDPRQKATAIGMPRHSEPTVELARSVGWAARDALLAVSGERFDVLSKASQSAAKKWLRREGPALGIE